MVELIFAILIIGALAGIAIPKFSSIRDDAELVQAKLNLRTLINDFTAYYTAKGYFPDGFNLQSLTEVDLYNDSYCSPTKDSNAAWFKVHKTCECLLVKAGVDVNKNAYISFSKGSNYKDKTCKRFLNDVYASGILNPGSNLVASFVRLSFNDEVIIRLSGNKIVW